jgi:hypothetical protein
VEKWKPTTNSSCNANVPAEVEVQVAISEFHCLFDSRRRGYMQMVWMIGLAGRWSMYLVGLSLL